MDQLYNWVFHYNHYTKMWAAIPRERYNDYWAGDDFGIIRSSSIDTLIELTRKVSYDPQFLDKIR